MTPKEKAEELVDKFRSNIISFLSDNMKDQNAKQCALIAVDELINLDYSSLEYYGILSSTDYWNEVKKEIEQMRKKICNYCQNEISKYGCACPAQIN